LAHQANAFGVVSSKARMNTIDRLECVDEMGLIKAMRG